VGIRAWLGRRSKSAAPAKTSVISQQPITSPSPLPYIKGGNEPLSLPTKARSVSSSRLACFPELKPHCFTAVGRSGCINLAAPSQFVLGQLPLCFAVVPLISNKCCPIIENRFRFFMQTELPFHLVRFNLSALLSTSQEPVSQSRRCRLEQPSRTPSTLPSLIPFRYFSFHHAL
jgi:hypothetical protein